MPAIAGMTVAIRQLSANILLKVALVQDLETDGICFGK